jgi:hypothetical protein
MLSAAWLRVLRVILVGAWGLILVAGLPGFVGALDRMRGLPGGPERQAATAGLVQRGGALFVAPAFAVLIVGYALPRLARGAAAGSGRHSGAARSMHEGKRSRRS